MNVRERIEKNEYVLLAPEAAKSQEAEREYPEPDCDYRSRFQRDRDRIIHSKAFRRLKHKTQVYISSGDHYRTRMTHSLEVAQIGRTIARSLRLNEDLTEAIALGHDVGHTAFGHAGEAILNTLTGHFAHNEQSLRVVKYLEKGGKGLNLTRETMDGIVHHSGKIQPFTLEGKIVHWADRIAYLCHDFDDSMRADFLKPASLPKLVMDRIGVDTSKMITAMVSDVIVTSEGTKDISFSKEMSEAMDVFRDFMFENIYHSDRLAKEREQAVFVLEQLYRHFSKNPDHMPLEFQQRQSEWGLEQTVVDYVAGITDSYAVHLFNEIYIPPIGAM
ncbi:MAG: deoxyguanosinetriphosphate triphosphohydrolase [Anaerovibrio sp.]|uniref:deoxyguanosinetriphosphate triphosphohydrolase n=1 Tax=Anaerovibrio sp. TaxID=1872532 RepID=UPI0025F2D583|nr:deoxyguanosinetriphosphate triphosphohydrolase [Anaerovibrio sp.]MCR5175882.1 deoxyguanosinetriphosphate triphosphohydrolase [Anaerovibrio sp.]